LYNKIGDMHFYIDFLKKVIWRMSTTEKRQKVVKSHPRLSLDEHCNLLTIHRSGNYYKRQG